MQVRINSIDSNHMGTGRPVGSYAQTASSCTPSSPFSRASVMSNANLSYLHTAQWVESLPPIMRWSCPTVNPKPR